MDRGRWLAAAAFGTLNLLAFALAAGGFAFTLLVGVPWLGALLWASLVLAAAWCLAAVDDLMAISARDAAALLVRGSMGGALVAALVGGIAFGIEDPANGLFGAILAGFVGLFAGLACALLDVAVLGGIRFLRRAPRA